MAIEKVTFTSKTAGGGRNDFVGTGLQYTGDPRGALPLQSTGQSPIRGGPGQIRLGDDASTYELEFPNDSTSLANIDTQAFMRDVIHEVQTEHSIMRPYVTPTYLRGTFEWRNLTPPRNPQARKSAIPDLNPRKQTFSTFGITVNPYDDDAWLVDAVEKNSRISVGMNIVKAMEMGFERLYDKVAFSSMLVSIRVRTANDTQVKTGDVSTSIGTNLTLGDDRIGAYVRRKVAGTAIGGNKVNAMFDDIDFRTLVAVGLKFRNQNVPYTTKIYAALTPNMERLLYSLKEYSDKDYIFSRDNDRRGKSYPFAGFEWVAVTPEVAPQAYYADRYIKLPANADAEGFLYDTGSPDSAIGNNTDLSATNHEVIPFWVKENVYVGECPQLDMFEIFKVPFKRQTPIVVRTKWLGASRAQNKLQYNLCVPVK